MEVVINEVSKLNLQGLVERTEIQIQMQNDTMMGTIIMDDFDNALKLIQDPVEFKKALKDELSGIEYDVIEDYLWATKGEYSAYGKIYTLDYENM